MNRAARMTPAAQPFHTYRLIGAPQDALPCREVVGSKALNLMVMARAGLPVPPGFVLGTDLCRAYMQHGARTLDGLELVLADELEALQQQTGRRFGDPRRPLLVSVRSGAAISMPGMMETVLNVGLTGDTASGLLRLTGNPRLVLDCRRRLLEQYAEVVHGADPHAFEEIVAAALHAAGAASCNELDTEALTGIVGQHEAAFAEAVGRALPENPLQQLLATIEAVLKSWMSERARSYRALNGIPDTSGTATLIQAMVFGNAGPTSGSGVGFTRNPADGSDALYIDYLANAQGEDVVAGRRNAPGAEALQRRTPAAYRQLVAHKETLEKTFGDMQDFEFTIEDGRLFMLQARTGKRTPLAALRIAHDLVSTGLITPQTALERLSAIDVDSIEYQALAIPHGLAPAARAVPASAGVVVGVAAFDPARIKFLKQGGRSVVLVRESTETADVAAVAEADALVTARGARTSHAAVVARQLGKVCLVGCTALRIDASGRSCGFGETVVREGDVLSLDGSTGEIFAAALEVRRAKPTGLLREIKEWGKIGKPAEVKRAARTAKPRSS